MEVRVDLCWFLRILFIAFLVLSLGRFFVFVLGFFFFRKISPELTAANPPLLLRKPGPELISMPVFLYFIYETPATAWLAKQCHVCTRDPNPEPRATEAERVSLTTAPPGLTPGGFFI